MPASLRTEARSLINKMIVSLRVFRERVQSILPLRGIFLVVGISSIGYGQSLMEQRYGGGVPLPQAELWNAIYRLQIVNFDFVLHALPYLFGGAFLCALTVLPRAWTAPFANWGSNLPSGEEVQWRNQVRRVLIGGALFVLLLIQLARHRYAWIYLILWLVSIYAFTHITWRWDRNAQKDLSPGITALDVFWVAILLILGFGINTFALQDIPTIMIADEGSFWETARAIAIKDLHPAFFDSGVYTFPVASSIYQGWILRIFGLNIWAWRFSSVIAGVITVIPLYLLGREWFGRHAAIAAAVIMVSNPYFIAFARLGYNNSQSLFPVTLCIYFFALAARKGSVFYLWLAGILAGIGFYTYFAAWISLVVVCLGVFYLLIMKQIKWKQALISLGIILLAWGVVFAPRIAYAASGENVDGLVYKVFETSFVNTFYAKAFYGEADLLQTRPLIPFSKYDTLFYDPVIYRELLLRGTVRTLIAIFDPHIIREHFLVAGFAGAIPSVFFLIGLALSLRLWKQLRFGLPLVWLASGLLFLSIIAAFPPRQTHLVSIIPAFALISGVGLCATVESLAESIFPRRTHLQSIIQRILLAIASIVILYFGVQKYFASMPATYPPLFEDIVSWIAWKTRGPADLIYLGQDDKPHRVEYLINSKLVHHKYRSLLLNDFSPDIISTENKPTIIFIESKDEISKLTIQKLPGFSVPIPYQYTDGTVIGYVMTNTVIDLTPKVDREEGWQSLSDTPVRWILIVLAVVGVVSCQYAFRRKHDGSYE